MAFIGPPQFWVDLIELVLKGTSLMVLVRKRAQ